MSEVYVRAEEQRPVSLVAYRRRERCAGCRRRLLAPVAWSRSPVRAAWCERCAVALDRERGPAA